MSLLVFCIGLEVSFCLELRKRYRCYPFKHFKTM
uniref:Uncharacterized protein n=1 Tax=Arundo donax TaxID=35708 RepID=A0A0A9CUA3_ARUDO